MIHYIIDFTLNQLARTSYFNINFLFYKPLIYIYYLLFIIISPYILGWPWDLRNYILLLVFIFHNLILLISLRFFLVFYHHNILSINVFPIFSINKCLLMKKDIINNDMMVTIIKKIDVIIYLIINQNLYLL